MINIINVGLGNYTSVKNWALLFSSSVKIISNKDQYKSGSIIIPGVSSSTQLMKNLITHDFISLIKKAKNNKEKIIGFCSGFQVLGSTSTEDDGMKCLDFLPFKVKKMKDKSGLSIGCTGWKKVKIQINKKTKFGNNFKGRKKIEGEAYFNHEYAAIIKKNAMLKNDIYHVEADKLTYFIRENIYGFQFHPEKSLTFGKKLLGMLE